MAETRQPFATAQPRGNGSQRAFGVGNFIKQGGNAIQEAAGVTFLRMEAGRAVLSVESGRYKFASRYDREN